MITCPECRAENTDGSSFCRACAAPLASPLETPAADSGSKPGSEPEPEAFKEGRYVVQGLLGEGSVKKVYHVHDTLLDRDVAFAIVKAVTFDPVYRQRVLREAQTNAMLTGHPNVVPIFDYGEDGDQPFMVMPLMAKGSLEHLLCSSPSGKLELEHAVQIAIDVCQGLEFAHANAIIHRDIKPGNIWLADDGVAQIGDFGLALSPGWTRMTEQGMVLGTFAYSSPEAVSGGHIDQRSDLYSLGIVMYEMVAGQRPFRGEHIVTIIGQHINVAPVPPGQHNNTCTKEIEEVVLHLIAKDPADRPDSASALLPDLDAALASCAKIDPEERQPAAARSLQVLMVEDSPEDAELLTYELRRAGFEIVAERVETAAEMKEALENETWDLVISDHVMPRFSAPAALKLLQNSGLDLPFIIVSGEITDEIAVTAMRSGAHDFIVKRNLSRLVPAVERELQQAENRRAYRLSEAEARRLANLEQQRRLRELETENEQLRRQLDRTLRRQR